MIAIKANCNPDALPGAREWSRTVILVPRSLCIISTDEKPDVVSVDIGTSDKDGTVVPLRLISFYADKLQDSNIVCRHLLELGRNNCITVLGGDTNSHSHLWSRRSLPRSDNRIIRGRPFEDLILQEGFDAFIPPAPTYSSTLGESYIDLLACKRASNYCFAYAPTCGDHACLIVTLSCGDQALVNKPLAVPKRYPSRTNWETFSKTLNECSIVPGMTSTVSELDEAASTLSDNLSTAIKRSTRVSTARGRSGAAGKPVWWCKNLDRLRREYRQSRRVIRDASRHCSPEAGSIDAKETMRRAKRAYFNAIKQAKVNHLEMEFSKMDEVGVHRRFKTRTPTVAAYNKAEILDHFFGLRERPPPLGHEEEDYSAADCDRNWKALGGPLANEELETAIRSLKTRKACGHDGIFYEHVKYACQNVPWFSDAVKGVFNSILRLTHYPTVFKRADLCMLYKANGRLGPKAWRPVALTSCLGKFFELLLKRRLLTALGPPPDYVHGFVPHRSTITAVESIIRHQQQQPEEARTITVTFDVAAAFDRIGHAHIVAEITAITGISQWGDLVQSYLHGGDVHLDGLTTYRATGIPQGGVLSPVCFSASTWRVGRRITDLSGPFSIKVAIYADDFCVRIVALGVIGLSAGVRQSLGTLSAWSTEAELAIDREKTEALADSDATADLLKEELAGTDAQFISESIKRSIRWLGLVITASLSWRSHLDFAFGKALRCLSTVRRMLGKYWGISPSLALCAWRMHIAPTLLYAAELWGECSSFEWFRKRCSRLEATLFRSICGLSRSTSTVLAARCLAMVTEPLWIQARIRYATYHLHKVGHAEDRRVRAVLSKWGIDDCSRAEVPRSTGDLQTAGLTHGWHCELSSGVPPSLDDSAHFFFTDGSVTDKGNVSARTGSGVVRHVPGHQPEYEGRCYNTGPHANISQCEVVGLWAAVSWALQLRAEGDLRKIVYLCCDSQAAIKSVANALRHNGLASTKLTHDVANLIRRWVGQDAEGYRICLWWVRGHAGHCLNELSDLHAGRGARDGPGTIFYEVEKPASFTKAQLIHFSHVHMEEKWRCQRGQLAVNRLGLGLGRKQLSSIVKRCIGWKIGDRRRLFELLTFHSSTKGYLRHLSADITDWKCRYCRSHKEDLPHFFWCPSRKMCTLREKIWGADPLLPSLPGERPQRGLTLIRGALTTARDSGLHALRRFLRASAPAWSTTSEAAKHR